MSLESLMKSKIDEVRKEIKSIHFQNTTYGTYLGRLQDGDAIIKYKELLNALPKIPGLSDADIEILRQEIKQRINTVGKYENSDYNIDNVTNEEEFKRAVDEVYYKHRYDAGAMIGTLTPYEAEKKYNTLLELLNDVIGFSQQFKDDMRLLIQQKIKEIPAEEKAKQEEIKREEEEIRLEKIAHEQARKKAFEEAKRRFNSAGLFYKFKCIINGEAPFQLKDIKDYRITQINALYNNKKKK